MSRQINNMYCKKNKSISKKYFWEELYIVKAFNNNIHSDYCKQSL